MRRHPWRVPSEVSHSTFCNQIDKQCGAKKSRSTPSTQTWQFSHLQQRLNLLTTTRHLLFLVSQYSVADDFHILITSLLENVSIFLKNLDIEHLPPSSFSSRNNSLVYCSVITFSSYIPFTWDINVFKVWHSFSSRLAKDWTSASRTAGSYSKSSCCRSFKTPPSTTHHRKPSDLDRVSASARTASLHCFSLTCSKSCWVVCWSFTRRLDTVWSLMPLYAIYSCWKSP